MTSAEAGAYFAAPFDERKSVAAITAPITLVCRTCLHRVTVPGRFSVCPWCRELVFPERRA